MNPCVGGVAGDGGYTQPVTTHSMPAQRGWFITIEGPEGGGKTSQAEILRSRLAEAGLTVNLVREPGGTPAGELIRGILLAPEAGRLTAQADALLFNAARAQLVADVIRPALERGEVVLSARFADSTLAYQGFGSGSPLDELRALERFATGGLRPDLTILLDLAVELGLGRKVGTEVTRFEAGLDLAFHRRVRDGFRALAAAEPERFVVVDAAAPSDVVSSAILGALVDRLPGLIGAGAAGRAVRSGAASGEPESDPMRITR